MRRDNQGKRRQPAGAPKSIGGQFAADRQRGGAVEAPTSVEPEKTEKNIWEMCGKCGGEGSVSWGEPATGILRDPATGIDIVVPKVCYTCRGNGGKWVSQQQLDRREKDRERRWKKREQERQQRLADEAAAQERQQQEVRAKQRIFLAGNEGLEEDLSLLQSNFGNDMRQQLDHQGQLTERQVEAIRSAAAVQRSLPKPAPVVEGRGEITGKVIALKYVENAYGGQTKMLVVDDRGFKVWGSVPRSLLGDEVFDEETDRWDTQHGLERGSRVTFTGTAEVSADDETFGFFSRPTKAALLPRGEG